MRHHDTDRHDIVIRFKSSSGSQSVSQCQSVSHDLAKDNTTKHLNPSTSCFFFAEEDRTKNGSRDNEPAPASSTDQTKTRTSDDVGEEDGFVLPHPLSFEGVGANEHRFRGGSIRRRVTTRTWFCGRTSIIIR